MQLKGNTSFHIGITFHDGVICSYGQRKTKNLRDSKIILIRKKFMQKFAKLSHAPVLFQ